MSLNIPGVLLLIVGLTLSYAAVTNKDPREVVRQMLGGQPATTPISAPVTNPPTSIVTTPTIPTVPNPNPVWV